MLTIWGRCNSFNVQKVMWLVGELALPYRHISVGGGFGGLNTPEFLAMNPHGKIPVICDNETVVWESHAILRYLAASYGEPSFWTNSPKTRSLSDRWMNWLQTTLQPDFLTGVFWGFYRTPEIQRDWVAIEKNLDRCTQHFQLLDKELANNLFLCGDSITLADITIGTVLYRYFELEIERPVIKNVQRWYNSLQARPAYKKHVMIPFSDMEGRLAY